jgi:tRNA pseudouridine38-40 synthase
LRNIRLTLAYDGTDFHGWQRQPNLPTLQECVENAIESVTGSKSSVWASGRTDAGVHAAAQVANLKTECAIPCSNLVKALNDLLPPSVRVKEANEVPLAFHARYQAKSKVYRYRILQAPFCSPFIWRFVYHYPYALDHTAMAKAARLIEGTHDFTSFAAAGEEQEARSKKSEDGIQNSEFRIPNSNVHVVGMVRTIFASRILNRPKTMMLIYNVRGSGFLHHMVRNIMGTLMEVGRGKIAPDEILCILNARDRTLAGPTAPAQGLCLMKVEY